MTPRMAPERRAEIENQLSWWKGKYGSGRYADRVMYVDGVNHLSDIGEFSEFGTELLAEIDALTAELAAKDKALDQATPIVQAYARHNPKTDTVLFGIQDPMGAHFWLKKTAELRKREGQ